MPITAPQLCVFTRWTRGRGEFLEKVRLIGTDGTTELRAGETQFQLGDPSHPGTNVTFFPALEFKEQGVYQIEVSVDGVVKGRFPMPLVVMKPNEQGQPTPPPAPAPEEEGKEPEA